ncbi:MAG: class I SAM-dependent methyltransferase [Myxococcota bacterium]|nr:class I SAM-dependent methyltransferase [Myxococcota bacterium]
MAVPLYSCSLCKSNTAVFTSWQQRLYYRCPICSMIQLSSTQHPGKAEEKAEYLLHDNDPYDTGYRRFLRAVTDPVLTWLEACSIENPTILDFGCGPGPALSVVLAEHGWSVFNYDPFFYPKEALLERKYDLITCTETVEHFHLPASSWKRLISLLKPNGQLVSMTQCADRFQTPETFHHWRYIREKSHVVFYHSQTMQWIADHYCLSLERVARNVFWFTKDASLCG